MNTVGAILVSAAVIWSAHKMSAALDRLVKEVEETKGVAASAVAALSAIPQLIRDAIANANGDTDAKLNELADDLDASIAPLAGALNANPNPSDPGGGDDTTNAPAGETLGGGEGNDTLANGEGNDVTA